IDLDPVPPKHFDSQFKDDIQNDEEQDADNVNAQEQPNLDEDVHPELPGKRALKNKWVYKLKIEEHTSRPRYKARLVVKGFSQKKVPT
nr:retrovirus-related Pol polyprotein from transposon TNT 1-94 [Tanacetum cinerariifolium]